MILPSYNHDVQSNWIYFLKEGGKDGGTVKGCGIHRADHS